LIGGPAPPPGTSRKHLPSYSRSSRSSDLLDAKGQAVVLSNAAFQAIKAALDGDLLKASNLGWIALARAGSSAAYTRATTHQSASGTPSGAGGTPSGAGGTPSGAGGTPEDISEVSGVYALLQGVAPPQKVRLKAALGCVLGGFVGDAAGATLEFQQEIFRDKKGDTAYLDGMVNEALKMKGGGHWGVGPGQVTDDSELTIALLSALASEDPAQPFPTENVATAYINWINGKPPPFDIGNTCRKAFSGPLDQIARNADPRSQANGALMRCAPIGVWVGAWASRQANGTPIEPDTRGRAMDIAVEAGKLDASLSHPHAACQSTSALFCLCVAVLVMAEPSVSVKDRADAAAAAVDRAAQLDPSHPQAVRDWLLKDSKQPRLLEDIECNDVMDSEGNDISGWVKFPFTLAFYFLRHAAEYDYETAIRETLLKGGDTDTNAKIVGDLMGALHGVHALPKAALQRVLAYDCTAPPRNTIGKERGPEYKVSRVPPLVRKLFTAK
jgi:ADP-ribosylglycohydrolase